MEHWVVAIRWGVPLLLELVGLVLLFTVDDGVEAWALFTAAAVSVWLIGLIVRIGNRGELERDAEDEARAYFDEHGHWPDQQPRA